MILECPKCNVDAVRLSRRKLHEFLLSVFGLRPFRCMGCDHRFFRFHLSGGAEHL